MTGGYLQNMKSLPPSQIPSSASLRSGTEVLFSTVYRNSSRGMTWYGDILKIVLLPGHSPVLGPQRTICTTDF